jgi:hypothetical protein
MGRGFSLPQIVDTQFPIASFLRDLRASVVKAFFEFNPRSQGVFL